MNPISIYRRFKKRVAETRAVITLAVSGLIFAILFPIVMTQVVSANTTGWNPAVAIVFATLFPVLLVLGLVLRYTHRLGQFVGLVLKYSIKLIQ